MAEGLRVVVAGMIDGAAVALSLEWGV